MTTDHPPQAPGRGELARAGWVNLDQWRQLTGDQKCSLITSNLFIVLLLTLPVSAYSSHFGWFVSAMMLSMAGIASCVARRQVRGAAQAASERRWFAFILEAAIGAGAIVFAVWTAIEVARHVADL